VKKTGVHIAFCAGTGALVFIDLVAHLIRKVLGCIGDPEDQMLDSNSFHLALYVSFQDEKEAIGLDLMRGLDQLCKQKNS
jgi:hypothetical protein